MGIFLMIASVPFIVGGFYVTVGLAETGIHQIFGGVLMLCGIMLFIGGAIVRRLGGVEKPVRRKRSRHVTRGPEYRTHYDNDATLDALDRLG